MSEMKNEGTGGADATLSLAIEVKGIAQLEAAKKAMQDLASAKPANPIDPKAATSAEILKKQLEAIHEKVMVKQQIMNPIDPKSVDDVAKLQARLDSLTKRFQVLHANKAIPVDTDKAKQSLDTMTDRIKASSMMLTTMSQKLANAGKSAAGAAKDVENVGNQAESATGKVGKLAQVVSSYTATIKGMAVSTKEKIDASVIDPAAVKARSMAMREAKDYIAFMNASYAKQQQMYRQVSAASLMPEAERIKNFKENIISLIPQMGRLRDVMRNTFGAEVFQKAETALANFQLKSVKGQADIIRKATFASGQGDILKAVDLYGQEATALSGKLDRLRNLLAQSLQTALPKHELDYNSKSLKAQASDLRQMEQALKLGDNAQMVARHGERIAALATQYDKLAASHKAATTSMGSVSADSGMRAAAEDAKKATRELQALQRTRNSMMNEFTAASPNKKASIIATLSPHEGASMADATKALGSRYASILSDLPMLRSQYAQLAVTMGQVTQASTAMGTVHNTLHSALRGVTGVLGGLWLSYAKMVPVLLATAGATKAVKDSMTGGMDTTFKSQFIATVDTGGRADPDQLRKMRDSTLSQLTNVSRESVFTVEENADALKKLSLAGVEASRGIGLLATASNAAIYAGKGLGETTEMILDSVYNFGLASMDADSMADNFTRVADVMSFTAASVNAGFDDIAKSFQNVVGVAGTFGVEVEEVSALLANLAQAGVRGPKAGTFVRNFLDEILGAPNSDKAQKMFDKLGVGRYDPDEGGEFGASKYIDNLVGKIAKLSFVEQQEAIRAITNLRSRRVLRQEILASYEKEGTMLTRVQTIAMNAEGALSRMTEGLKGTGKMSMQMAQASYNASVVEAYQRAGTDDSFVDLGKQLKSTFDSEDFKQLVVSANKVTSEVMAAFAQMFDYIIGQQAPIRSALSAIFDVAVVAGGALALTKAISGLAAAYQALGAAASVAAGATAAATATGGAAKILALMSALPAVLPIAIVAGGIYATKSSRDAARDYENQDLKELEGRIKGLMEEKARLEALNKTTDESGIGDTSGFASYQLQQIESEIAAAERVLELRRKQREITGQDSGTKTLEDVAKADVAKINAAFDSVQATFKARIAQIDRGKEGEFSVSDSFANAFNFNIDSEAILKQLDEKIKPLVARGKELMQELDVNRLATIEAKKDGKPTVALEKRGQELRSELDQNVKALTQYQQETQRILSTVDEAESIMRKASQAFVFSDIPKDSILKQLGLDKVDSINEKVAELKKNFREAVQGGGIKDYMTQNAALEQYEISLVKAAEARKLLTDALIAGEGTARIEELKMSALAADDAAAGYAKISAEIVKLRNLSAAMEGKAILSVATLESMTPEEVRAQAQMIKERAELARLTKKEIDEGTKKTIETVQSSAKPDMSAALDELKASKAYVEETDKILEKRAADAAASKKSAKDMTEEYRQLVKSVQDANREMTDTLGTTKPMSQSQKMMADATSKYGANLEKLNAATREQFNNELKLLQLSEERMERRELWTQVGEPWQKENDAIKESIETMELELLGLEKGELARQQRIEAMNQEEVAHKRLQASILETVAANDALGYRQIDRESMIMSAKLLKQEADLLEKRGSVQTRIDTAKEQQKIQEEWKKTVEKINDDLSDALLRGFESGKGFAENFRDTLTNMFKTMVLRPVISAMLMPVSQGVAGIMSSIAPSIYGGGVGQAPSGFGGGYTAQDLAYGPPAPRGQGGFGGMPSLGNINSGFAGIIGKYFGQSGEIWTDAFKLGMSSPGASVAAIEAYRNAAGQATALGQTEAAASYTQTAQGLSAGAGIAGAATGLGTGYMLGNLIGGKKGGLIGGVGGAGLGYAASTGALGATAAAAMPYVGMATLAMSLLQSAGVFGKSTPHMGATVRVGDKGFETSASADVLKQWTKNEGNLNKIFASDTNTKFYQKGISDALKAPMTEFNKSTNKLIGSLGGTKGVTSLGRFAADENDPSWGAVATFGKDDKLIANVDLQFDKDPTKGMEEFLTTGLGDALRATLVGSDIDDWAKQVLGALEDGLSYEEVKAIASDLGEVGKSIKSLSKVTGSSDLPKWADDLVDSLAKDSSGDRVRATVAALKAGTEYMSKFGMTELPAWMQKRVDTIAETGDDSEASAASDAIQGVLTLTNELPASLNLGAEAFDALITQAGSAEPVLRGFASLMTDQERSANIAMNGWKNFEATAASLGVSTNVATGNIRNFIRSLDLTSEAGQDAALKALEFAETQKAAFAGLDQAFGTASKGISSLAEGLSSGFKVEEGEGGEFGTSRGKKADEALSESIFGGYEQQIKAQSKAATDQLIQTLVTNPMNALIAQGASFSEAYAQVSLENGEAIALGLRQINAVEEASLADLKAAQDDVKGQGGDLVSFLDSVTGKAGDLEKAGFTSADALTGVAFGLDDLVGRANAAGKALSAIPTVIPIEVVVDVKQNTKPSAPPLIPSSASPTAPSAPSAAPSAPPANEGMVSAQNMISEMPPMLEGGISQMVEAVDEGTKAMGRSAKSFQKTTVEASREITFTSSNSLDLLRSGSLYEGLGGSGWYNSPLSPLAPGAITRSLFSMENNPFADDVLKIGKSLLTGITDPIELMTKKFQLLLKQNVSQTYSAYVTEEKGLMHSFSSENYNLKANGNIIEAYRNRVRELEGNLSKLDRTDDPDSEYQRLKEYIERFKSDMEMGMIGQLMALSSEIQKFEIYKAKYGESYSKAVEIAENRLSEFAYYLPYLGGKSIEERSSKEVLSGDIAWYKSLVQFPEKLAELLTNISKAEGDDKQPLLAEYAKYEQLKKADENGFLDILEEADRAYGEQLSELSNATSEMANISLDAIKSLFQAVLSEAKSAEEAVQLGTKKATQMLYEQITTTMVNAVSKLVFDSIVAPMSNTIMSSALQGAAIETAGSTTAAANLTTASTAAGVAVATGGFLAGEALTEVLDQVTAYVDLMSAIFTSDQGKEVMGRFATAIGSVAGALYTGASPFLGEGRGGSSRSVTDIFKDLDDKIARLGLSAGALKALDIAKEVEDLVKELESLGQATDENRARVAAYGDALRDFEASSMIGGLEKETRQSTMSDVGRYVDDTLEKYNEYVDTLYQLGRATDENLAAVETWIYAMRDAKLKEVLKPVIDGLSSAGLSGTKKEMRDLDRQAEEYRESLRLLRADTAENMALIDSWVESEKMGKVVDVFEDMISSLESSLFTGVEGRVRKIKSQSDKYIETLQALGKATDSNVAKVSAFTQAMLDLEAANILEPLFEELATLGLTDTEKEMRRITTQADEYRNSLEALGRATEGNMAVIDAWEAAMSASAALREAEEASNKAESELRAAYDKESGELQDTIDKLKDFTKTLKEFRKSLWTQAESPLSERDRMRALEAEFYDLAALASTGDEDAIAKLEGTTSEYLELVRLQSISAEDYYRRFAVVQNVLERTEHNAERELLKAESQLELMERQVGELIDIEDAVLSLPDALANMRDAKEQLENSKAQVKLTEQQLAELRGNSTRLTEVKDVVRELIEGLESTRDSIVTELQSAKDSIVTELQAIRDAIEALQLSGTSGGGGSTAPIAYTPATGAASDVRVPAASLERARAISSFVADTMNSTPNTQQAYTTIYNAAVANGVSAFELARTTGLATVDEINAWVDSQGLPRFAKGGLHTGGLRLVGEEGPELEFTGPARYWSHSQTKDMLSGGDQSEVVAELRSLREEVQTLRSVNEATARSSHITAKSLDRVTQSGRAMLTEPLE